MQKMLATKKDEDVQKGMCLILILRNKLGLFCISTILTFIISDLTPTV